MNKLWLENYIQVKQNLTKDITYEIYVDLITVNDFHNLNENVFSKIKNMKLPREILSLFRNLKNELSKIAQQFKLSLNDIITVFKHKDVYKMLKAFGFNIKLIFKSINEITTFIRSGLLEVFKVIYKTKTIQKLRSGVIKIDDFLNKYPILKKIGGVAIAGLLIYLWLNMTFIGDLDYDFNFSDVIAALKGSFSIADLFLSPEGLMLITLFGSGALFGLSIPWLGRSLYNLVLAIFYTIYNKIKENKKTTDKIKRSLKIIKVR